MSAKVNVSISSEKLAELIQSGHLCAADLNCLDAESKQQVWQLCLWSCNKRVNCTKSCTQQCNSGYCPSPSVDNDLDISSGRDKKSALVNVNAD